MIPKKPFTMCCNPLILVYNSMILFSGCWNCQNRPGSPRATSAGSLTTPPLLGCLWAWSKCWRSATYFSKSLLQIFYNFAFFSLFGPGQSVAQLSLSHGQAFLCCIKQGSYLWHFSRFLLKPIHLSWRPKTPSHTPSHADVRHSHKNDQSHAKSLQNPLFSETSALG